MSIKKRYLTYKANYAEGDPTGPFVSANVPSSSNGEILLLHPSGKVGITAEGGLVVKLKNKTNTVSQKGWIVSAATSSDDSYQLLAGELDGIGYVYNQVQPNEDGYVVVAGIAEVQIGAGSTTPGAWYQPFLSPGGSYNTVTASAGPMGLGAVVDATHFKETGHGISTLSSGSLQLARAIVHFN